MALAKCIPIPFIALMCVSCGSGSGLFPLHEDQTWTYNVDVGMEQFVEPVKVVRRVAVAGEDGYELSGNLGGSRLAWKDGQLVASELNNLRFQPPLVLLAPGVSEVISWKGTVGTLQGNGDATAQLSQAPAKIKVGTETVATTLATLIIRSSESEVKLETWYLDGTGPIRQTQHTNGKQDFSAEILGGR